MKALNAKYASQRQISLAVESLDVASPNQPDQQDDFSDVCLNLEYLDNGSDDEKVAKHSKENSRRDSSTQDESYYGFDSESRQSPLGNVDCSQDFFPQGNLFGGLPAINFTAVDFKPSAEPFSFSQASAENEYSDSEVLDNLASFCFDQAGNRMLQRKIETSANPQFVRHLIRRLMPIFMDV